MSHAIDPHSVRLTFLDAGQARWDHEWIARKTVPFSIIAQVTAGAYEVEYDGRTTRIEPGEAFYAAANTPLRIVHRLDRRRKAMGARWVHFAFTAMGGLDLLSLYDLPGKLGGRDARQAGEWIEDLLLPAPQAVLPKLQWISRRTLIAWSLLELVSRHGRARPEAAHILLQAERLAPVLEYVRRHLDEPIDVERLARQAHLSASRFHSLFKQQIGETPLAHVKRMRLNHAGYLLAQTEQTLAAIADRVGLQNPFHLSREFKRQFGMSPSAYRRLNRQPALLGNAEGSTG